MAPVILIAAGAAAMYFFDPEKGEARRSQMRSKFDQFRSEHPEIVDAAEGKTVHLRNRAKGLFHETRAKIENKIDPPINTPDTTPGTSPADPTDHMDHSGRAA